MYEAHFGLKKPLFDKGIAQDATVFLAPKHEAILANCKVALTTFDSALVLTGVAGVGKTTLISAALRTTSTRLALGWITSAPANAAELLELLLVEFGFDAHRMSRVERTQIWRQFLNETNATATRVYVIAERAEDLAPEVLRAADSLTAADASGSLGANLVLLGQPALTDHLRSPVLESLCQRIRLRQRLEPLTQEDLEAYVDHHVRVAGGRLDKIFAPGAIRALHDYSGGIPRVVNNLCESALALAANGKEPVLSGDIVKRVAVGLFGMEPVETADELWPSVESPAAVVSGARSAGAAVTGPAATRAATAPAVAGAATTPSVAGAASAPATPASSQAPRASTTPAHAAQSASAQSTAAPSAPAQGAAPAPRATAAPSTPPAPSVASAPSAAPGRTFSAPASPGPLASPAAPATGRPRPEVSASPPAASQAAHAAATPAAPVHGGTGAAVAAGVRPTTAAAPRPPAAAPPASASPPPAAAAPPPPAARAATPGWPPDSAPPLDAESLADELRTAAADAMLDFPVLTDAIELLEPPAPRPRAETAYVTSRPQAAPAPVAAPAPQASVDAAVARAKPAAAPPQAAASAVGIAPAKPAAAHATPPTDAAPRPTVSPAPAQSVLAPVERDAAETDLERQTQTMRALAAAKTIDDISNSMAETLFSESDLAMLSAALESAGWSDDDTVAAESVLPAANQPAAGKPTASAPAANAPAAKPAAPAPAANARAANAQAAKPNAAAPAASAPSAPRTSGSGVGAPAAAKPTMGTAAPSAAAAPRPSTGAGATASVPPKPATAAPGAGMSAGKPAAASTPGVTKPSGGAPAAQPAAARPGASKPAASPPAQAPKAAPKPMLEEDPFDFLGLGSDSPLELIEDPEPGGRFKKAAHDA